MELKDYYAILGVQPTDDLKTIKTAYRRLNADHQIEKVGSQLRDMMPWIKAKALVDKSKN